MPSEHLTSIDYWQKFWDAHASIGEPNPRLRTDREIASAMLRFLKTDKASLSVVEVGCTPGKWLVFLNRELHYRVAGIDWLPSGIEQTRQNLLQHGIPGDAFDLFQTDFLKQAPSQTYDIVVSLGFIEHFSNTEEVFARHLDWLKPGGTLFLGVPNFRGVNRLIQMLIDRHLREKILTTHNLKTMKPRLWLTMGRRFGLEDVFVGYCGGFEPALFNPAVVSPWILRFGLRAIIKVLDVGCGSWACGAASGNLIAVFRKPRNTDPKND